MSAVREPIHDGVSPAVLIYFDAFLARELNVVQLGDDDYALYASGRRNFFGTTLSARGPEAAIRAEHDRCRLA